MQNNIWDEIVDEYELIYSNILAETLYKINLTYEYLEDFIKVFKNIDQNICLAAINKELSKLTKRFAKEDINRLLNKYNKQCNLYYISYTFPDDYYCSYGSGYKDVYLVFAGRSEIEINNFLLKFNKLKAFA